MTTKCSNSQEVKMKEQHIWCDFLNSKTQNSFVLRSDCFQSICGVIEYEVCKCVMILIHKFVESSPQSIFFSYFFHFLYKTEHKIVIKEFLFLIIFFNAHLFFEITKNIINENFIEIILSNNILCV